MTAGAEFITWLGQAAVVGVGWWVVHRLSASRDLDKARRELVAKSADGLSDAVSVLLGEAREYHVKGRDEACELRIKMTLQDLAMRITGLSEVCSEEATLAPCRAEIASLRRAITGQHFEDEHVGPLSDMDGQFQSIAAATLRAKRSLLKLKHRQFPHA